MGPADWNITGIGIALVGLVAVFAVVAFILIRWAARLQPPKNVDLPLPLDNHLLDAHQEAVLIVKPGGQLQYMNQRAHQIFAIPQDDSVHLEQLSRRIRPQELFLGLCTAEGQARLILDGKTIQGTSYFLPFGQDMAVLVSLHEQPAASDAQGQPEGIASQTFQNFLELTRSMASSLELEETILSALQGVDKMVPADFLQMTIWEAENQVLSPYRYQGHSEGEHNLERGLDILSLDGSISGTLAIQREPILVDGQQQNPELLSRLASSMPGVHSYVGVPLLVGQEFIGTLELGSLIVDAYRAQDLELLVMLGGQAAVAVHNALLYRAERRRALELAGLAQLTQAFSVARDPQGLFGRLVQSIVPLIHVEILGFMIYNENQRVLEGKVPFYGLPPQFLELYRVQIHSNSPMEKAFLDQDMLSSENAAEDPQWQLLGLDHLSQSASLKETVLVPLSSGSHVLGYLQASNHLDGSTTFTKDEMHLLQIIANQAAPIIENAALVQQSRQRALRAEALRRIASLVTSAANLDEILKFALQELAHLLQTNLAAALVVDQNRIHMAFNRSSFYSEVPLQGEEKNSLLLDDPQFPFTVTGNLHAVILDTSSQQHPIIPFYQQLFQAWGIVSAVVVPLVVRDEGIGEIWLGSPNGDYFNQGDLQVIVTAAGQLAGVVEQSYLASQTDESLRRRVEQLTALTRISRELSTSLDLSAILKLIYDEAVKTTRADCGSVIILELEASNSPGPVIRHLAGEARQDLSPLEVAVLQQESPIVISDFSSSSYALPHPEVQSTLLTPIRYQQRQVGLVVLHSRTPNQFDASAVEISQSLASQAAVALGNTSQYEDQLRRSDQLAREMDTMGKMAQVVQSLRADQPLQTNLEVIARAIQQSTSFQRVFVSMLEEEAGLLRPVCTLGPGEPSWGMSNASAYSWEDFQQLLLPEFQNGSLYYMTADQLSSLPEARMLLAALAGRDKTTTVPVSDWLFLPVLSSLGKTLGMISLCASSDGRQPGLSTQDALLMYAMQAGLTIENQRQLERLQTQLQSAQMGRLGAQQALDGMRENLPMLLRQQMEQAVSIQKLESQEEHMRAGMEIAILAARQPDATSVLNTLAREMLMRFDLNIGLVGELTPAGPHLLDVIGSLPSGANPEAFLGQRNPLRQILEDQQLILVSNLEHNHDWGSNPLLLALETHSFVGLPVALSAGRRAGLLLTGGRTLPDFTDEDRLVFTRLSTQVSITLQNLQFLEETRRRLYEVDVLLAFTRELGGLDPDHILHALLETSLKVLTEAHAGWVAVFDMNEQLLVPRFADGYTASDALLRLRFPVEGSLVDNKPAALPMPVRAFHLGEALRVDEIDMARDYTLPADDLLSFRKALGERIPISSLVAPIRRGENLLGLLVLDNFSIPAAFSYEDEVLSQTLTQQAAMALENAHLYVSAEQRAGQLQALTHVASTISSSLMSQELIALLLDQLAPVIFYDTAILWLRQGDRLSVAAARGFADSESRIGLSVAVQDSVLFNEMIHTGMAISVADVRKDDRFPSFIEPDYLSWLGIPMIANAELIGVIALEQVEPYAFSGEHIQMATTFAGQAAMALENSRLYEESLRRAGELDQRSQRMALLNRFSSDLGTALDVNTVLSLTARQLQEALKGDRVAVVWIDLLGDLNVRLEIPEFSTELPFYLPACPLMQHLRESQGIFSSAEVSQEDGLLPLWGAYLQPRQVVSLLSIPLVSGTNLYGWMWVENERSYRFSVGEIELSRTICNQAAIAVQNALLFAETRRLTEDLEERVEERTAEMVREQRNTQTLLNVITELSSSLDLSLVMNRTLTVMNDSIGSEQAIILLSGSNMTYQAGAHLAGAQTGQAVEFKLEKDISRWVIRHRAPALVEDMESDGRWKFTPEEIPAYHSVMAVPLVLGEEISGSLILFHQQPGYFLIEQVSLIEAAARQISITLNNAELFNLIRDQAENLGAMLRDKEIEVTRTRAILEAVADGVLVTDVTGHITLFNASAQRILNLEASQVVGQSLDQFMGFFGKAAQSWMQTIRTWSNDSTTYQGEIFAQQINLDNDHVVSVHLAAVIYRTQFLGTVSVFRDITHEVQVDRLKSEFVANVSHELRTPMTSIKGYVEIIMMGAAGPVSDQQKHFLEIVKSNTERLSVLVNDLLDISRIEAGRVTLSFRPLELAEIAEDVEVDIQRRSREENKPMTFQRQIPAILPPVKGDPDRLRQVLGNLVTNGYQYTPAHGTVLVRMSLVGNEVQVDVVDDGIGIALKDQARMFERFYRGEDPLVLATAGTGLGLALCKVLVEMHGGRVWFESPGESGQGSTFSFTIPVFVPEE